MLIGEYESRMTQKNRIAVPKRIRSALTGDLVVSRGYEGCLILLDKERWMNLVGLIGKEPILNLSVRDTRRFILGGAQFVDLDSQGRFVVSASLISFAELQEEVMFIGLEDWVEIWSRSKWEEKLRILTNTASDIAEELLKINDNKHSHTSST